ncbi:MAG TPA: hypothetical protein VK611_25470 [Acidimicrobiales bacterium]|nr:hypothetical protein [Acidimicrobiales bacterium]
MALVVASIATFTGWSSTPSQTPDGSTLNRPVDAAVITGQQAQELVGTAPGRVVAFRVVSGQWQQVPVQVDERKDTTMAAVYGLPTSQTFYSSSINIPVNVYADPNTFTGADADTNVDADDEIAFMVRDAGAQADATMTAPAGTSGQRVEVKLAEPGTASDVGHVYLFASDGSLDPGAGQHYVDYQFRLDSGDYKTTYKRTDGPNPENSTVTGTSYTAHHSDRWTMDGVTLRQGNKPDADVIDRVKYDIQLFCARNENTFNDEEGAFVVNRTGPVRAIRSYVGANSGPNTQNTQVFYDTSIATTVDLRVHAIPNVAAHLDFSREALGMTYRNAQVPDGVPIDGMPDTVAQGTPNWWTYSGPQGGIAASATYDVDATTAPQTWYEDDDTPTNAQCTGDSQAIGDSGAFFNQWINCTDPGTNCSQHLKSSFRVVLTPPSTTPAELQRLSGHYLNPLVVTVNGRGGGGDGGQCVTALNSAHATAGRATTFLVWAWAVGTGDYLGATWDTTSLRQTSTGIWDMVPSC